MTAGRDGTLESRPANLRANLQGGAAALVHKFGSRVTEVLDESGDFVYAVRQRDGTLRLVDPPSSRDLRRDTNRAIARREVAAAGVEKAWGRYYMAQDLFGADSDAAAQARQAVSLAKAIESSADTDCTILHRRVCAAECCRGRTTG